MGAAIVSPYRVLDASFVRFLSQNFGDFAYSISFFFFIFYFQQVVNVIKILIILIISFLFLIYHAVFLLILERIVKFVTAIAASTRFLIVNLCFLFI